MNNANTMQKSSTLQINWSIWDNNPTVSWACDGKLASVSMKLPPIAVSILPKHEMIAIVANYDEFGSDNLLMYSYDGLLLHTFTAPSFGQDSQFGGVIENGENVDVIVAFKSDSIWKEEAGVLNLSKGTLTGVHRNY